MYATCWVMTTESDAMPELSRGSETGMRLTLPPLILDITMPEAGTPPTVTLIRKRRSESTAACSTHTLATTLITAAKGTVVVVDPGSVVDVDAGNVVVDDVEDEDGGAVDEVGGAVVDVLAGAVVVAATAGSVVTVTTGPVAPTTIAADEIVVVVDVVEVVVVVLVVVDGALVEVVEVVGDSVAPNPPGGVMIAPPCGPNTPKFGGFRSCLVTTASCSCSAVGWVHPSVAAKSSFLPRSNAWSIPWPRSKSRPGGEGRPPPLNSSRNGNNIHFSRPDTIWNVNHPALAVLFVPK